MPLSALTFHRQFARFDKQIQERSGGEHFVSFTEGLPARWEDYKGEVRSEALRRLKVSKWKRADIGKGRILSRVIEAIEIHEPGPRKLRNNLVNWPNKYGHERLPHRALLDAKETRSDQRQWEQWFFDFFRGKTEDKVAFERFMELAGGKRYELIAYVFFLKDSSRFMPIATSTFDKAFRLLGIELTTGHRCSWENYVEYNGALVEIQRALRDVAGVRDPRLIDAHSFCWMLVRQAMPAAAPAVQIPLPTVISDISALEPETDSDDEPDEYDSMSDDDFTKRDAQRRQLGRLAQDIAFESEKKRLTAAGHSAAEGAVVAVWDEVGRGFDILSCEMDGTPRHIEVKAARRSGQRVSFFVTQNEWRKSRSLPNYFFYLVFSVSSRRPSVRILKSDRVTQKCLAPINYLASVQSSEPSP